MIFLETWSPSFCFVCNFFDNFRTNLPKNIGRFNRKGNTNFSKWRWVRSKIVCLSSALLFSLVITKKYVLRNSWGISARSNTCFLFKCRVTFHLRYFLNATFATLALSSCVWDVLRYRILKKTAFVSWAKQKLSKTTLSTFQKMSFWAPVGSILWLYIKKLFWALPQISPFELKRVSCSNAESHFGCAIFWTLSSVPWPFRSAFEMSCNTE